jgi:hypothetical protein
MALTIIGICFVPAVMLWNSAEIDDSRLTTYELPIADIGITQIRVGRGPKNHDIVYFKLNGLPDTFGLNYLDDPETITYILNNVKKEDTVKVTIEEMGEIGSDGINYHLHHFESHGKIYFDNKHVKGRNKFFAKIMFGMGLFFSLLLIWFIRYVRNWNINQLKVSSK